MRPLLQIQSIPIAIEYRVTPAQVERRTAHAEVEIQRNRGGLQIRTRPIQLNIDSFEARNSVVPTAMRSIENYASLGRQAALQGTGTLAHEGTVMLDIHLRESPIPRLAAERLARNTPEFNINWLPDQPVNMDWIPGELHIEYHFDQIDANWQTNQSGFEFTPGSIEFVVAQHPQVIIEFVGEPIFVPPSANPNYQPAVDILT